MNVYPLHSFARSFVSLSRQIDGHAGLQWQDEQLKLLATDGMLVKRPLFVSDDFVLVGFKASEWEARLK